MFRALSTLIALLLVVAACGGGTAETTTTADSPGTTGAPATTQSPDTTQPPAPTTTAAPDTTTGPTLDSNAVVEAKTAAVEASLPEGWTGSTVPAVSDDENEDLAYAPCLLPDDFDIDNLDDYSAAALQAEFEGPDTNPPFAPPMGAIEARVFNSEQEAADAFAVFERVWGTPEGLDCMTQSVISLMGDDFPAGELSITTEAVSLPGSQAGARFEMSFDVEGFTGAFYVEFQGTRMGDCTVIASFLSFGEPFPRDVAETVFGAALDV